MKDGQEGWIWLDGRVQRASQARVPVLDRGFLYGDSVYEVTRTFDGVAHLLGPHLERLARSAAALYMSLPPRDEILQALDAVIAQRGGHDLYLRIVVTRGDGELGLDPALASEPRLVIVARPVSPPPPEAYRDGVAVLLSSRRRSSPELKTGNYLESVLATREARQAGAHEALLRDASGRVTEGGSSNVFVVSGGRLGTPPVGDGLLPGITRAAILQLARSEGIGADEAHLWPIDLERADELFLSSSIRGVLPVVRLAYLAPEARGCAAESGLAGRSIGDGTPGPVTRRVMELYAQSTRR